MTANTGDPLTTPKPSVGRIVHYVSHGTPVRADGSQAYTAQCRAAIITEVPYGDDPALHDSVGLAVLNPTGMFFNTGLPHEEPDGDLIGGTWHWPERI